MEYANATQCGNCKIKIVRRIRPGCDLKAWSQGLIFHPRIMAVCDTK